MSEKPTDHTYPHQTKEDVSTIDLASDFQKNPAAYHPALHEHIKRHIGDKVLEEITSAERSEWSASSWRHYLEENPSARLSYDEVFQFLQSGNEYADIVTSYPNRVEGIETSKLILLLAEAEVPIETIEAVLITLGGEVNKNEIFDLLIENRHITEAIQLAWDFSINDFDQEKLLDAADIATLPEIALFIGVKGDVNQMIKNYIKNDDLDRLFEAIDYLPADKIDAQVLQYGFINAGLANHLVDQFDTIKHLPMDWQRIADATIYEGRVDVLFDDPFFKPYVNYQKAVEQMSFNNCNYIFDEMDTVVKEVDHTLLVNMIMKMNTWMAYESYSDYIDELLDAEVDYELLTNRLAAHVTDAAENTNYINRALQAANGTGIIKAYLNTGRIWVVRDNLATFLKATSPQELASVLNDYSNCLDVLMELALKYENITIEPKNINHFITSSYSTFNEAMVNKDRLTQIGVTVSQIFNAFINAYTNDSYYALRRMVEHPEYITELDINHAKLIRMLCSSLNGAMFVIDNKDKFPSQYIDYTWIAEQILLSREGAGYILDNLERFEGSVDPAIVCQELLRNADDYFLPRYKSHLQKYLGAEQIIRQALQYSDSVKIDILNMVTDFELTVDIMPLLDSLDEEKLQRLYFSKLISYMGPLQYVDYIIQRGYEAILNESLADCFDKLSKDQMYAVIERLHNANMHLVITNNLWALDQYSIDINYVNLRDNMYARKDAEGIRALAKNILYMPEGTIDHSEFAEKLLDAHEELDLLYALPHMKLHEDQYIQLAVGLIENGHFLALIRHKDNFLEGTIDYQSVKHAMLKSNKHGSLLDYREYFPDGVIDPEEIIEEMLDDKSKCDLGSIIRILPQLSGLNKNIAFQILEQLKYSEWAYSEFAKCLGSFEGLTRQDYVDVCVRRKRLYEIPLDWQGNGYIIDFSALGIIEDNLFDEYADDHTKKLYLYQMSRLPVSKQTDVAREALRICGANGSDSSLNLIYEILHGDLGREAAALGITKTGIEGTAQFEEILQNLKMEINSAALSVEMLQTIESSQVLQKEFMQFTRFKEAAFGRGDTGTLKRLIDTELRLRDSQDLEEMPREYKPSTIYDVELLESSAEKDPHIITKDVIERYSILRNEVIDAVHALREKRGFTRISNELRHNVEYIVHDLEEKVRDTSLNPKAIENMHRRIRDLGVLITAPDPSRPNKYPLRSFKNLENNFRSLSRHDELQPAMRKFVFAWALRRDPEWNERVMRLNKEPTIEDISSLHTFIDKIVNNASLKEYFTDKKNVSIFKRMTSTKALEEALARNQGRGIAKEVTKLQIQPTRGLLMEVSGQIADACWAGTYESIGRKMPNMSALLFRQNPGTKSERLVGAALLIETKEQKSDTPVLLLRGVNPIENYINKVSVESFHKAVTDYVEEVARARGMKAAIVIDDHSGGSGTNRPALHKYFQSIQYKLENVRVTNDDTEFNGYSVVHNSFAL